MFDISTLMTPDPRDFDYTNPWPQRVATMKKIIGPGNDEWLRHKYLRHAAVHIHSYMSGDQDSGQLVPDDEELLAVIQDTWLAIPFITHNLLIRDENETTPYSTLATIAYEWSHGDLIRQAVTWLFLGPLFMYKTWTSWEAQTWLWAHGYSQKAAHLEIDLAARVLEETLGHQQAVKQLVSEIDTIDREGEDYIPD